MRIKIFLVLLLCALQQVYGSKSTEKNGGSRLKKWVKNCLVALTVNYVVNWSPQEANRNSFACKYNIPDKKVDVMMNFFMCANDEDFEKYMFDYSENCAKIEELYTQEESGRNCDFNTPKFIYDGKIQGFRTALVHTAQEAVAKAVENAKKRLELTIFAYPNDNYNWEKVVDKAWHPYIEWGSFKYKDINVEHAKRLLGLTKLAYPNDTEKAIAMALQNEYEDVNTEHAKELLDLTKLVYPNDASAAVVMALNSEYKDVNVAHAKGLLELTKLMSPVYRYVPSQFLYRSRRKIGFFDDTGKAVLMALDSYYKDVNVKHAKRVLELTKLAYPHTTDTSTWWFAKAVSQAINPKYNDVNVDRVKKRFQFLKSSWSWYLSSEQKIMKEALKMTYGDLFEVVKEDF